MTLCATVATCAYLPRAAGGLVTAGRRRDSRGARRRNRGSGPREVARTARRGGPSWSRTEIHHTTPGIPGSNVCTMTGHGQPHHTT